MLRRHKRRGNASASCLSCYDVPVLKIFSKDKKLVVVIENNGIFEYLDRHVITDVRPLSLIAWKVLENRRERVSDDCVAWESRIKKRKVHSWNGDNIVYGRLS